MVGVGDGAALGRAAPPEGHLDGVDDELGADVVGDGPPDDAAAERVEHDGQVHLALAGRVLGDVHHPQPVRSGRVEGPVHEVLAGSAPGSRRVQPRPLRR